MPVGVVVIVVVPVPVTVAVVVIDGDGGVKMGTVIGIRIVRLGMVLFVLGRWWGKRGGAFSGEGQI